MKALPKNALLSILATGVSSFGGFVAMVAFSSYIYIATNSPMNVGIFLTCRVCGGIFGSFCANLIFSWARSLPALFWLNMVRLGAVSTLIWLPISSHTYIFPVIGLFLGICGTVFGAGVNSQLPEWVDEKLLVHVNGYMSVISGIAIVSGSLIAGLIISFLGFHVVFAITCMSYLLSGIFIISIKTDNESVTLNRPSVGSVRKDIVKLMQALKVAPVLSLMLFTTLADTLGSASHNVGFPILSKILKPENAAATMGYILAIWAVGQIIGARVTASYLKNKNTDCMERIYFLGVILMSSGFILAFWQSHLTASLLFFAIAGTGDGISEVSFVTRAQRSEKSVRLLLFSTISLMQQSGFGMGMLISAFVFSLLPAAYVVSIFHGIPLAMIGYFIVRKAFLVRIRNKENSKIEVQKIP